MRFLILILSLFVLASCAHHESKPSRALASERQWGFLVFSDIHVYTKSGGGQKLVPNNFKVLVEKLLPYVDEHHVKFIVINGDSTGGNPGDNRSLADVRSWWNELKIALTPLTEKGVKIVLLAGNHDYYTENHQAGYKYAWKMFMEPLEGELEIRADNPLYYTLNYGSMELYLLHAVKYQLGAEQEKWLSETSKKNKNNGQNKVAFGHVALYSRISDKPIAGFGDKVKKILKAGDIHHYVGGHEHCFWDEMMDEGKFRQTITGTSSGTYNYIPLAKYRAEVCKNQVCTVGPDKLRFPVDENGKQVHRQMFSHISVDEGLKSYELKPMALSKGEIVPFTLP